jgi:hypothetical protein
MLRRISGPKREEVADCIMRSFITCSFHQIFLWYLRWAGHVTCTGEMINVYIILVGKHERKRPLGRPRRRWEVILDWILEK